MKAKVFIQKIKQKLGVIGKKIKKFILALKQRFKRKWKNRKIFGKRFRR